MKSRYAIIHFEPRGWAAKRGGDMIYRAVEISAKYKQIPSAKGFDSCGKPCGNCA